MSGLPMGSRISGLLANIYVDHIEHSLISSLPIAMYKRYVDDIFIITDNEETADSIFNKFNECNEYVKFEIEKPSNNSLSLLDFCVTIAEGRARISFYQKNTMQI